MRARFYRVCREINLAARRESSRASLHTAAFCPEPLRRHLGLGLSHLETGLLSPQSSRAFASSTTTARNSPPSRSTTPSARFPRAHSLRTGRRPFPPASASASRLRSASRTSPGCATANRSSRASSAHSRPCAPAASARCSSNFRPTSRPIATSSHTSSRSQPSATRTFPSPSSSATRAGSPTRSSPSCASTMPRSASPRATISPLPTSRPHHTAAIACADPAATPRAELDTLAERFVTLAREGEVFVFLKHEDEPTGAINAMHLQQRAAALSSQASARRLTDERFPQHQAPGVSPVSSASLAHQRSPADHRRQLPPRAKTISPHLSLSSLRSAPPAARRSPARFSASVTGSLPM